MDDPLVHMRIEAPILVSFEDPSTSEEAKMYHDRKMATRMLRGSKQVLTIFVLPIAATTTLLWMLLVYLLRDTEGRDVGENGNTRQDSPSTWHKGFRFSTLPRACGADIERLDATSDASTIIGVSLENEVAVWSRNTRSFFDLPISDIDDHGCVVTSVAMDSVGAFCAVGTRSGVVKLWRFDGGRIAEQRLLRFPSASSRVVDLSFEDRPALRGNRPSMLHRRSLSGDTRITDGYLLVTYKDGSVIEWNDLFDPKPILVAPASNNTRAIILRPGLHESLGFALITSEGDLQIFTRGIQNWQEYAPFTVSSSSDGIVKVHAQTLNIDLSPILVIATATQGGQVSVWDGISGQRWYTFEEPIEDVNRLRITSVPSRLCPTCEEIFPDMFILTISTGTMAQIHRFAVDDARRCSCPMAQPTNSALRSRQSSFTSGGTPFLRSRVPALSTSGTNIAAPAFPVSAHGVHSRKGSERDPPPRRKESGFYLFEEGGAARPDSKALVPTFRHTRIAEVSFEEGAWDTLDHLVYGLKRSVDLETLAEDPSEDSGRFDASSEKPGSHFEGLERHVLERWRLWVFDPTSPNLMIRESTLVALAFRPNDETEHQQTFGGLHNRIARATTHLPSQRPHCTKTYLEPSAFPRLPFTEVSSLVSLGHTTCLAAFGNTIGLITFTPNIHPYVTRHSRAPSTTTNPLVAKKRI